MSCSITHNNWPTAHPYPLDALCADTPAEPITGLCWPPITDGEDNVLISLQPGAIMSIVAPIQPASSSDLMYSSHEVPSRIIATEAPLLHITAVKGDKFGVVYGLAADKLIHKILLPADNAAWAGVKGRAVRTASKVNIEVLTVT